MVTNATEKMSSRYNSSWRRGTWRRKKAEKDFHSSSSNEASGVKYQQGSTKDKQGSIKKKCDSTVNTNISVDNPKNQHTTKDNTIQTVLSARQRLSEAYNNLSSKRKSSKSRKTTLSSSSLLRKEGSGECSSNNTSDKKVAMTAEDDGCESLQTSNEHHTVIEKQEIEPLNNNFENIKIDCSQDAKVTVLQDSALEKDMSSLISHENSSLVCDKHAEKKEIPDQKEASNHNGVDMAAVAQLLATSRKGGSVLHTTSTVNIRLKREQRATRLLKGILLCFIVLWLPYNLTVIISSVCPTCISTLVWNLGYWLCYLNSTVNPFCYGFCNDNFKRTFKAILTTKWWTTAGRRKLRSQVRDRKSLTNKSGRGKTFCKRN